MIELEKLVRKNILNLKPYSSARDEFSGSEGIFLDANENPFGENNRYPDPHQNELKNAIASQQNMAVENIFLGNGSDEIIDLLFRIFCRPGVDRALTFTPTYGMYEVSSNINDVDFLKVPLNQSFQIDFNALNALYSDERLKLIFVCSPNNPTGNIIHGVENILEKFSGVVVVDEAYIHFSNSESWAKKIEQYNNLVVLQTFSKARGLAAARIGIAYASKEIIHLLNKVKPPYNISTLNQQAALKSLQDNNQYETELSEIINQKLLLEQALKNIKCITKVYPSNTNFLLVETVNANAVYECLIQKKIIVRNRNAVIHNCLRITVGTAHENQTLLNALKEIKV
jgi:histidinol-phosphate aminotransferase